VLIDWRRATVESYQSDISRTFVFGKPSDKMKKVFDIVHSRAGRRAETALASAVECQTVDAAASQGNYGCGFGPDYKFFNPPGRPRNRHGRPRVDLPGSRHTKHTPLARNMTFQR